MSTCLPRRAARDDYTAFAAVVKAATNADVQRNRQEFVQTCREHIMSIAHASSFRIFTSGSQKRSAKLNSLTCATRSADKTRSRMRVVEGRRVYGGRAATVSPKLGVLCISRDAWLPSSIIFYKSCMIKFEVTYF